MCYDELTDEEQREFVHAAAIVEYENHKEQSNCDHETRYFGHEIPHEGIPAHLSCDNCGAFWAGNAAMNEFDPTTDKAY